jgi:hypothetical protein
VKEATRLRISLTAAGRGVRSAPLPGLPPLALCPLLLLLYGAAATAQTVPSGTAPSLPATLSPETSSTATGISRLLNPAISLNALLLGKASRDIATAEANGFDLQEVEMQLSAIVDPFWRADVTLAVHPAHEHEHGEEVAADEHAFAHSEYVWDLETVQVTYRNMPRGFGLVVGKFYLPFGKYLPLHTHQYPFVQLPIGVSAFTGDHGLTEVGAQLGWTLPLPWFSDLAAYGVSARVGPFDPHSRDLTFGGRWMNLWDLGDETTLEASGSGLAGPALHHADEPGGTLAMYGADVTLKWISSGRSRGPALTWTAEVLVPDREHDDADPLGFYSYLQYRFAGSWWCGVTGGFARDVRDAQAEPAIWRDLREYKANVTLAPSEFSAIRLELSYLEDPDGGYDDLRIALQGNFTIGSHPAHLY